MSYPRTRADAQAFIDAFRAWPDLVTELLEPVEPPTGWFIPGTNLQVSGTPIYFDGSTIIAPGGTTGVIAPFEPPVPCWISAVNWSVGNVDDGTPVPLARFLNIKVQDTDLYTNQLDGGAQLGSTARLITPRNTEESRLWFMTNRARFTAQVIQDAGLSVAVCYQVSVEAYRVHTKANPAALKA